MLNIPVFIVFHFQVVYQCIDMAGSFICLHVAVLGCFRFGVIPKEGSIDLSFILWGQACSIFIEETESASTAMP